MDHIYSLCGRRKTNEDTHICRLELNSNDETINKIDLLAVFDGHGGKEVSNYIKHIFIDIFFKKYCMNPCPIIDANSLDTLKEITDYVATTLKPKVFSKRAGSTMCLGLRYSNDFMWIMNCGDSRAVICTSKNKAAVLTTDHKPNTVDERKRIKDLGGKVYYDGGDWRIHRLSVSRSYGDLDTYPYVTHTPDIILYNIKNCKFIIFGCDGLWDVYSNTAAVNYILNIIKYNSKDINIEKKNYAKELALSAYNKGSGDNITVIVYFI